VKIQGTKGTPTNLRLLEVEFNYHVSSELCVLWLFGPHRLSLLQKFIACLGSHEDHVLLELSFLFSGAVVSELFVVLSVMRDVVERNYGTLELIVFGKLRTMVTATSKYGPD